MHSASAIFAPTTAYYRLRRRVPDENIPGTLNVGHSIPVVVEAFIFISAVAIDVVTLVAMIGAAVVGAWLGAGVVARLPRRTIQLGMGQHCSSPELCSLPRTPICCREAEPNWDCTAPA